MAMQSAVMVFAKEGTEQVFGVVCARRLPEQALFCIQRMGFYCQLINMDGNGGETNQFV